MAEPNEPPRLPRLSAIYFYPTQDCNLRCPHCWVDPPFVPDRKARAESGGSCGREMDGATFEALVLEAMPLGLNRVKFTGGEPFLRSDLCALMAVLHRNRVPFDIETNGTLVTSADARRMKRYGCFQASVSLDSSTPEFHDRFRGVKGAFRRAERGISRLLSAGLNVQVIMSLLTDNEDEIEPSIALAARLGANSIKVNPITPGGRGLGMFNKGKSIAPARLIELMKRAEKELAAKHRIPVVFSLPLAFQDFDAIKSDGFGRCHILNIMGILGDGSISMCGIGKEEPDLVVGRYPEISIEKAWRDGSVFKELREKLPRKLEGACGRCILKGVCLGYCRANAYTMDRNLMAPYWFCEAALKEGGIRETRMVDQPASPAAMHNPGEPEQDRDATPGSSGL